MKKMRLPIIILLFLGILNFSLALADEGRVPVNETTQNKNEGGLTIRAEEQVQVSHSNFLNKKIEITSSGKFDENEQRIRLGLRKNEIFGSHFFVGMDISGQWEQDDRFSLKGRGFDFYAGEQLNKNTKVTLKFEHRDTKTYDIASSAAHIFKDNAGEKQVDDVVLLIERSTLDERRYPTKGAYQSIEWNSAVDGLGSDYNFNRLILQARGYLTPGKFFTFTMRTKLGWMETFGSTGEIPYFERFFMGGSGTVRGYKGKHVGPKDNFNLPLGGVLSWVNNFELRFPLYKRLKGAYFFDFGGLWSSTHKFAFEDLRCGTGFGLRYITKWGVARIDYGIRLTHEKDEPRSRIHLTFGVPF